MQSTIEVIDGCDVLVKLLSDGNENLEMYLRGMPDILIELSMSQSVQRFYDAMSQSMYKFYDVLTWLHDADIKGNLLLLIIKRFDACNRVYQDNQFARYIWQLYTNNVHKKDYEEVLDLLLYVSRNPNETAEDIHEELLKIL